MTAANDRIRAFIELTEPLGARPQSMQFKRDLESLEFTRSPLPCVQEATMKRAADRASLLLLFHHCFMSASHAWNQWSCHTSVEIRLSLHDRNPVAPRETRLSARTLQLKTPDEVSFGAARSVPAQSGRYIVYESDGADVEARDSEVWTKR